MENKQTAVEFLLSKIIFMPEIDMEDGRICMILKPSISEEVVEQAKEMEKEQIKDAYEEGEGNAFAPEFGCEIISSEQYYEETYGK